MVGILIPKEKEKAEEASLKRGFSKKMGVKDMANLIGYLEYGHHAGTVHRLAHKKISSRLATWTGNITTYLDKDGDAHVDVDGAEVWRGNIHKLKKVI
jgi:hypothetical protein